MNNQNKLLGTISLSKRAGKLVMGFDMVKNSLQIGESDCAFIASDISPKTEKEIRYICTNIEAEVYKMPITLDEIWYTIGKRAGILCIKDYGLSDKLKNMLICEK